MWGRDWKLSCKISVELLDERSMKNYEVIAKNPNTLLNQNDMKLLNRIKNRTCEKNPNSCVDN